MAAVLRDWPRTDEKRSVMLARMGKTLNAIEGHAGPEGLRRLVLARVTTNALPVSGTPHTVSVKPPAQNPPTLEIVDHEGAAYDPDHRCANQPRRPSDHDEELDSEVHEEIESPKHCDESEHGRAHDAGPSDFGCYCAASTH